MIRNLESKHYARLIEGGCWLVFVTLAAIYTFDFDDPLPVYRWGPAHWPRVVLFGMFVSAIYLLYTDFRRRDHRQKTSKDPQIAVEISAKVRMVLIFAVPLMYTVLMHRMGFLLVTPFFLFVYMMLMGVNRLRTLILMTVGIYSALVLVFVKLIFTYLPPGIGVFNTINGKFLGLIQ